MLRMKFTSLQSESDGFSWQYFHDASSEHRKLMQLVHVSRCPDSVMSFERRPETVLML